MSRFNEESSHYYDHEGKPVFEVPKKDGTGMRPTTVADARKLNLLPSVTTILSTWPKTAIMSYRLEQLLKAATTVPRHQNEPEDLWHSRIIAVSEMHRNSAAEMGSAIHAVIENWLLTHVIVPGRIGPPCFFVLDEARRTLVRAIVEEFATWMGDNGQELAFSEKQLLNLELGYCGTADLCYVDKDGRKVLADIKNQSVKRDSKGTPKPAYYDTWAMQLAAYDHCGVNADEYASIVINRDKAEPPFVKFWTQEEREAGWRRFRLCQEVWSELKNYRYVAQKQLAEAA